MLYSHKGEKERRGVDLSLRNDEKKVGEDGGGILACSSVTFLSVAREGKPVKEPALGVCILKTRGRRDSIVQRGERGGKGCGFVLQVP